MFISGSFFKGLIDIPNVEDTAPNSNLLGNSTELDLFIEEFEPEILIKCLGYDLYELFTSQFDLNGVLKQNTSQKWKDLLNGKVYEVNGYKVKWQGLVFKSKELDRSLLADYIFCEFLNNDVNSYNGTGVQRENSKNSDNVSIDPKYVMAFRRFYKMTEFTTVCCGSSKGLVSLYDFIRDMNNIDAETYPKWQPTHFINENSFGL